MILDDFKRVESSNAIRYGSVVDISKTTANSKKKGLPPSIFFLGIANRGVRYIDHD